MFSDFPSLHPLAVHFPIVLILLAFAFQAVVTWKLEWTQIRWATLLLMAAAFASALAASTFLHAMLSPTAPKSSWIVFNEHEKYAQYTLWMSGCTLVLKAIGEFYKINKRSFEFVVLGSSLIAAIFLSIAGHHGAQLVHIEGVGAMGKYLGTEEDEKNMENMGVMQMGANNKDSSMNTKNTMSAKQSMLNTDTTKNKEEMNGMNMNNDFKNKPKKEKNKGMNMDEMNMDTKKNIDKNKTDDMKGMNINNDNKNNSMKKDMGGMNMNNGDKASTTSDKKDDMGGMNMNKKKSMDTISLEDNNPKRNPKKKNN